MFLPAMWQRRQVGRGSRSTGAVIAGQSMDLSAGYYSALNSPDLPGVAAGFTRWAMVYVPAGFSNPSSSEIVFCNRANSGTRSWIVRLTTSGTIDCYVADSFPTYVFSNAYTITDDDKGKFHVLHMVADGTTDNDIKLYWDGQAVGSNGTWSSYTAPNSSDSLTIGALGGGSNPLAELEVVAAGGTDSVIATQYQCVQHYSACLAAGTGAATGWSGELWWNVDSAADAPSSWEDETATETLTKTNTVTVNDNAFDMYALSYGVSSTTVGSNYYRFISGSNPFDGSTSMTIYVTAVVKDITATTWPSGSQYFWSKRAAGTTKGWNLALVNAGKPYLYGECGDGTATWKTAPTADASALSVGDVFTYAITLGSNTLRAYFQGSEVGSGTVCTGYTPPDDTTHLQALTISSFDTHDIAILGLGMDPSNTASASEISTWHTNCLNDANGIVKIGLANETCWNGEDLPDGGNWNDTSSTYLLSEVGTTLQDYPRRTW